MRGARLVAIALSIVLALAACGAAGTANAPVSTQRERCAEPTPGRDAGVYTARVEVGGPRLARQLARAWCDSAATFHTGQVEVDGPSVTMVGWESSVELGRRMAQLVRDESEAAAGEPFTCHGPGTDTPPHEEVAGAAHGDGLHVVDLAPLETRISRSAAAQDRATRFCVHFASDHGRAAIIGRAVIVTDSPEILDAYDAEIATSPGR
jgi:hypothetical protein